MININMIKKRADSLIILIFGIFLIIIIRLFSKGYIILGGEGNYFLDFVTVLPLYRYTWNEFMMGTGGPNPMIHFSVGIFDFFSFLQSMNFSVKNINIISIFLVYFLPFISTYIILRKILKIKTLNTFLVSLFYILNPFSTYHLGDLMFWNCAPMVILPIAFGIIYKYFDNLKKLFIYFGLFSLLVSFGFANIPYLGIFHISIVLFLFMISILIKNKIDIKKIIINFIGLELSFILFSLWWLIPLIQFQQHDSGLIYTKKFAIEWARNTIGDGIIMTKLFTLTALIPYRGHYNFNDFFFTKFYYHPLITFFLLIPFGLVTYGLLQKNRQKIKYIPGIALFILGVMFLNKGANEPFGHIYIYIMEHVPFFMIFKTPLEKFSVLFVFLLVLYLALLHTNHKRLVSIALVSYLLICSIPYLTLNFIPDYRIEKDKYVSRKFIDKPAYQSLRNKLNKDNLDYRVLSLPGSLNYQVTMFNHDNKYYRGMDPVLYAINKPFIAAYSNNNSSSFNILFSNISNKYFDRLLSLYNVKKIVINKDIYPSFGFRESETIQQMENIFSNDKKYQKDKSILRSISLYNLKSDHFLPHIYSAPCCYSFISLTHTSYLDDYPAFAFTE